MDATEADTDAAETVADEGHGGEDADEAEADTDAAETEADEGDKDEDEQKDVDEDSSTRPKLKTCTCRNQVKFYKASYLCQKATSSSGPTTCGDKLGRCKGKGYSICAPKKSSSSLIQAETNTIS